MQLGSLFTLRSASHSPPQARQRGQAAEGRAAGRPGLLLGPQRRPRRPAGGACAGAGHGRVAAARAAARAGGEGAAGHAAVASPAGGCCTERAAAGHSPLLAPLVASPRCDVTSSRPSHAPAAPAPSTSPAPTCLTSCPAPRPGSRLQVLRLAVLDLVTHMVVANGALVQSCLQTLVYSLLPPPGPPLPDPNPGEAWQPAEGQAQVQDEVVAAAEKVRAPSCGQPAQGEGGRSGCGTSKDLPSPRDPSWASKRLAAAGRSSHTLEPMVSAKLVAGLHSGSWAEPNGVQELLLKGGTVSGRRRSLCPCKRSPSAPNKPPASQRALGVPTD